MKLTGIVVISSIALASCAHPQRIEHSSGSSDPPTELARVLTDYETAWRKKDAAALASLFAEDGFVLTSGNPPARGRNAILAAYKNSGGPLYLHALAWARQGDLGYIIGGYTHDPKVADSGKFTLTLKKSGGRWLIMSDMDNGNSRPR